MTIRMFAASRRAKFANHWLAVLVGAGVFMSAVCHSHPAAAGDDGGSSSAPSDSDRAAAQVLFDQGRDLAKRKKWEKACVKFAESMRLDGAIGTQLNLANCYEQVGKTASAWINYVEAGSRARKEGQEKRANVAKERADKLEPKLSRLRIDVPNAVDGLVIKRDGNRVGKAQYNLPLPIDPGTHKIEVSAPGKRPWSRKFNVRANASLKKLIVPELRDAPKKKPEPVPTNNGTVSSADDGSGMRAAGWVMGAFGVAGLGLGIAGGVIAKDKNEQSLELCEEDAPTQCVAEGAKLRDEAFTFAHVATGGFALAGVGLLTGIILLAAAPSGDAADEDVDGEASKKGEEEAWTRFRAGPMLDATSGRPNGFILQGSF